MPTVAEMVRRGESSLAESGIPDPRREAASLLSFALGRDRAFLIAHPEYDLSPAEEGKYDEIIHRRSGREPFHYITGVKEFYGLDFTVTPAVLIPRPETEMLVERSIEIISRLKDPRFCEVGVGSGCISIAALVNVAGAVGTGLEIKDDAIEIAIGNAARHGVDGRLELRRSDVFSALSEDERFDLIVSNPPYIPLNDIGGLQPDVRDHEPVSALTDSGDGLSIIRRLVGEAPRFLKPGGILMFEFGFGQSEAVRSLFLPELWRAVQIDEDFQGIPRTVTATLANT